MSLDKRPRPPVAVVALGDPEKGDEGIPMRAMGRARTLIGEIGRLRAVGTEPASEGSSALALASPVEAGLIVEWIETGVFTSRLDRVLEGRRRVVLLDVVHFDSAPGTVHHWNLLREPSSRLTLLRHFQQQPNMGFEHLAFWLEDQIPPAGLDLIGVEPHDCRAGGDISPRLKRRLATISSQVAAILVRILAEEGW